MLLRRVHKGSFAEQTCGCVTLDLDAVAACGKGSAMKIGYARVSTEDQHLDLQRDALHTAGCGRIYEEKVSGASSRRPALRAALRVLRRGDVLVVWKLDRLGRSLQDLLTILNTLERRGIGFCSQSDSIDTTTPAGKFIYQVTGAFAEFEREMISERTKAGMRAARRKGRRLGRPRRMDDEDVAYARFLARSEQLSMAAIASKMEVGKTTVWRAVSPRAG